MTRLEFDDEMGRLGLLRNPPAELETFWDLFQSVPAPELRAGISHAVRTRTFFPVPAELFEDCDTARPQRTWTDTERMPSGPQRTERIENPFGGAPLVVTVHREWAYYCQRCSDSGWVSQWCGGPAPKPWQFTTTCARPRKHDPHEWVERCACVPTNPAIQRRRDSLAQTATAKANKVR